NIAKFDHPKLILIHSAFEENNNSYYVMEYIEGESLSSMVHNNGKLPEKSAVGYIAQVGSALDYIHQRKVNHLDVKPANIMVRRSDDTPILIDFGLSKQYDSEGKQTSTTPTGISHGFAPLEQYSDGGVKEFAPQTDIYSLAATLYYLLSGTVPLRAPDRGDEDLTFPKSIHERLIAPISRAMSLGRKGRHADVNEFIRDIEGNGDSASEDTVIDGGKKKEEKKPTPKPLNPTTKKSKGSIYIIAAVAVAALVGALIIILIPKLQSPGAAGTPSDTTKTIVADAQNNIVPEVTKTVSNLEWESPLGTAVYSGESINDTIDEDVMVIPHGKGVMTVEKGVYAGAIYDGNFVKGQLEGEAKYTLSNGDTFTGTFHRNQFDEGKYVDKASGEYYVGTYRDGQPYKGKWYSSDGRVVEELK
ncbi:MAG: protein kinase, partial [Muribaculaceae bacterium]|nr:protein kinase [Muribaculaceae bacterium]